MTVSPQHASSGAARATRLAVVLRDESRALRVAASAAQSAALGPAQVRVLGPAQAHASREELLGPEAVHVQPSMVRTLARAHVWLGVVGALVGWFAYEGFRFSAALQGTRGVMSSWLCVVLGAVAGLLLGGFASMWPEHALLLRGIRRALRRGRWVVLVTPINEDQMQRAEDALSRMARGPVMQANW